MSAVDVCDSECADHVKNMWYSKHDTDKQDTRHSGMGYREMIQGHHTFSGIKQGHDIHYKEETRVAAV